MVIGYPEGVDVQQEIAKAIGAPIPPASEADNISTVDTTVLPAQPKVKPTELKLEASRDQEFVSESSVVEAAIREHFTKAKSDVVESQIEKESSQIEGTEAKLSKEADTSTHVTMFTERKVSSVTLDITDPEQSTEQIDTRQPEKRRVSEVEFNISERRVSTQSISVEKPIELDWEIVDDESIDCVDESLKEVKMSFISQQELTISLPSQEEDPSSLEMISKVESSIPDSSFITTSQAMDIPPVLPVSLETQKSGNKFAGKVKLHLIRGRDLQKMDTFRKSDPYAVVKYKDVEFKTDVEKNTLEPEWDKSIIIDAIPDYDSIEIMLFDWERIGKDEAMGNLSLNISELISDTQGEPKWYSLQNCSSGSIMVQLTDASNEESRTESLQLQSEKLLRKEKHDNIEDTNTKRIVERVVRKTTRKVIKRVVVIDGVEHITEEVIEDSGEKDDADSESIAAPLQPVKINESKPSEKLSSDEWVPIPIIRLDKIEALDTHEVTITELSDEEEPLDLTINKNRLEPEHASPTVITPTSELEEAEEMPLDLTVTKDSSTIPISVIHEDGGSTPEDITSIYEVEEQAEKLEHFVDIEGDSVDTFVQLSTSEPPATFTEIPILRVKPPSGKQKPQSTQRSISLNIDQDRLVQAEALQHQEALMKKKDDAQSRWSVNIPIIRAAKEESKKESNTEISKDSVIASVFDSVQCSETPNNTSSERPTNIDPPDDHHLQLRQKWRSMGRSFSDSLEQGTRSKLSENI